MKKIRLLASVFIMVFVVLSCSKEPDVYNEYTYVTNNYYIDSSTTTISNPPVDTVGSICSDLLNCDIESSSLTSTQFSIAYINNDEIEISGSDGSNYLVMLRFRDFIPAGTYPISGLNSSANDCGAGFNNVSQGYGAAATSGSITISLHDTTYNNISGTFSFVAPHAASPNVVVQNGVFCLNY